MLPELQPVPPQNSAYQLHGLVPPLSVVESVLPNTGGSVSNQIAAIRNAINETQFNTAERLLTRLEAPDLQSVFNTKYDREQNIPALDLTAVPQCLNFISLYHNQIPGLEICYNLLTQKDLNHTDFLEAASLHSAKIQQRIDAKFFQSCVTNNDFDQALRYLPEDLEQAFNTDKRQDMPAWSPKEFPRALNFLHEKSEATQALQDFETSKSYEQKISNNYLAIITYITDHQESEALQPKSQKWSQTLLRQVKHCNALEYMMRDEAPNEEHCQRNQRFKMAYKLLIHQFSTQQPETDQRLIKFTFDENSLSNKITNATLMKFVDWAEQNLTKNELKTLSKRHQRIKQIIQRKNITPLLATIWTLGPIGLMVGAISLMPNQNVFDLSILPTEYWMIAGIILATMVITTGAILSFTRITLKTQDQALLASEHQTQPQAARAIQPAQATPSAKNSNPPTAVTTWLSKRKATQNRALLAPENQTQPQ